MEAPIPGVSIGSMGLMMAMVVEVIVREMLGMMRCCFSYCRVQKFASSSDASAEVVLAEEREERSALTAGTLLCSCELGE
jgi:hypothetical protein